jgi:hypothetical protein
MPSPSIPIEAEKEEPRKIHKKLAISIHHDALAISSRK